MKNQHKKSNPKNNFQAHSRLDFKTIGFENFSLAFSKGISVEIRNRKNCALINQKYKKVFLQQIIEKGIDKKKLAFVQDQISKKLKCVEEYLQFHGFVKIVDTNFKNISRFCVGLGAEHVFETSLTLDYIWGIPYLPSSAIKGVCRSVAFWEIVSSKLSNEAFSEKDKIENLTKQIFQIFYNEDISLENNKPIEFDDENKILLYKLLFGTQNFEGLLTFLDAYPQNMSESKFELDIINCHYPDYYNNPETNPAGDWYNPQPINFLTVGPGIKFRFIIFFDQFRAEKLIKSPGIGSIYVELLESLQKDNFEALKEIVKNILKVSLTFHGIGAKTRLGYGLFAEVT